jgi:proteic killer suppression protein
MIRSFRDTETEKIFRQHFSKKLHGIEKTALRKLFHLNRATTLRDLALLPGNRLEALEGNRKGQYSIRINDQYRISSAGTRRMLSMSRLPTTIRRRKP